MKKFRLPLRAAAAPALIAAAILFPGMLSAQVREKQVVASTSWTAAIASAAGARNIRIIAPLDLKHPPEYEIKPSDLEALHSADLVVYSGYEKFAQRLAETAAGRGTTVLQVYTDNLPPVFKREALKVAEALGTVEKYRSWEASFDAELELMRGRLAQAYPDRRAAVHRYLATLAEWLGFEVVGTFGPGELSPQVLLNLTRLKPAVVIDNWHNISGKALAESLPCAYVELINFPGRDGTATVEDVFAYNERNFIAAARSSR